MRSTRVVLFALLSVMLGGCLLELESPELDVGVEQAYNDYDISVPFRVLGLPPGSTLTWELAVFDGSQFVYLGEQSVRVESEDSGLIEFGNMGEGEYELSFSVITSRGSGVDEVPSLAESHRFFVDRTAPPNMAPSQFNPPFGNWPANTPLAVTIDYDPTNSAHPTYDPGLLSPQRVLVTVDGAVRPPIAGIDEIEGNSVRVWDADQVMPGDTVTITWVVIDAAGNRSVLDTGVYTAQ